MSGTRNRACAAPSDPSSGVLDGLRADGGVSLGQPLAIAQVTAERGGGDYLASSRRLICI